MSEIEVLPRILILDGEAVYEKEGEFHQIDVVASEGVDNLIATHGKVLMVDLNGFRTNRPRLDFIKMFEKKSIWVDAGVRLADFAIDIFIGGAERTILRTETLNSLDELRKAHELSDQLIFQIDVMDGRIVGSDDFVNRDPRNLMGVIAEIGIKTCIYLEQGRGEPSPSILHGLPEDFELYVGPFKSSDSVRFENTGFKGILVDAKGLL